MTPTPTEPLSLRIVLEVDGHPIATSMANVLGRETAKRLGGTLAGVGHLGDNRLSLTIGTTPPENGSLATQLTNLDVAVHTVLAETGLRDPDSIRTADLQGMTYREVTRRIAEHTTPDVVGVEEACEILDVNRARLYELRANDKRFPAAFRRGVWMRASMERYASIRHQREAG
jgi:hypothetical protein